MQLLEIMTAADSMAELKKPLVGFSAQPAFRGLLPQS